MSCSLGALEVKGIAGVPASSGSKPGVAADRTSRAGCG